MPCALLLLCGTCSLAHADTAIETETAQIGLRGQWNFSQSYEFEHAPDGTGEGTLTQFEYGISDRAELLIEPFFYVKLSPDGGPSTSGPGDVEITPSYMAVVEDGAVPAVLVAMKVKVPTGASRVEGTGEYDYFPYLIFGKHYAGWTFNANIGVNFAGREEGDGFDRTVVWDAEAERPLGPKWTLFVEAFSAEDAARTVSMSAEYQFTAHFNAFLALGHTEESSNVFRLGFNVGY